MMGQPKGCKALFFIPWFVHCFFVNIVHSFEAPIFFGTFSFSMKKGIDPLQSLVQSVESKKSCTRLWEGLSAQAACSGGWTSAWVGSPYSSRKVLQRSPIVGIRILIYKKVDECDNRRMKCVVCPYLPFLGHVNLLCIVSILLNMQYVGQVTLIFSW